MQTNREDVGKRYLEVLIPVPDSEDVARTVSEPFRAYYTTLAEARFHFADYLQNSGQHHFFVSGAEEPDPETLALADEVTDTGVDTNQDENQV